MNHGARGLRTGLAHGELELEPVECGVGLSTMGPENFLTPGILSNTNMHL